MAARGRRVSSGRAGLDESQQGTDGLAREQISEVQRARILAAMVAVVRERGAGDATVARVVACAGVSRRTFYELFADREECFLAVFDQCVAQAARHVLAGYDPKSKWAGRLRTALINLLTFLDVERDVGWLLVVGSYGGGPSALERRRQVLAQIIEFVDTGRTEGRAGGELPPLTAEGVVGGIFSLIHSRMVDGDGAPLIELLNPLMSMVVLPYLGNAAARRELTQPVPAARNGAKPAGVDPLRDLDMRLTYRTVRVLLTIGAQSGASNRQVADSSGIRDQGQVSKLLTRLEYLDLISNNGDSKAKGEPNAWTLTERGADVWKTISKNTIHESPS